MKRLWLVLGVVLAAGVSACSGGGSAGSPPAVSPAHATTSPATTAPVAVETTVPTGTISFVILVPKAPASTARRPQYLSSGTQSMVISTNGAQTAEIDLTPSSPSCTVVAAGLQCTVMANAPIGSDTFAVVTYDQTGGAGDILSQGTASGSIVSGTNNFVRLTLAGVVASVAMSVPPIPTCTATAVALTVNALDAAGYTIVGSTPYQNPITLKLTNAKNSTATTLTGTSIAKPGDGATLTYNGGYEPGSTVTASGSGFSSAYTFFPTPTVCNQYSQTTATFPHLNGITTGSDGNLYVGSYNTHQMLRISPTGATIGVGVPENITAGPTAAPVMGIGVPVSPPADSAEPLQAVTGPDKNLWIADGANGIDEFGVPVFAVQNNYGGGTYQMSAVAVGPAADGRLWFTDFRNRDVAAITTAGVLTDYPLTSGSGYDPEGIVAGPDGAMWFTEDTNVTSPAAVIGRITTDGSSYTEYAVPDTGSGSRPQDIVVGGDGNLWFDDRVQDAIGRLTTSGTFTMFPIPDGTSGVVYGMTTGPDGNIWFIGDNTTTGGYVGRCTLDGTITQYPIPNTTDETGPFQITVTPDFNLWFTETYGGTSSDGQVGYLVI